MAVILKAIEPPAPLAFRQPTSLAPERKNPVATEAPFDDVSEAVAPSAPTASSSEGDEAAPWPSDDAEAAALSDARERGEPAKPTRSEDEDDSEQDTKNLPTVTQMVEKLPEPLKEKLDELFRARWSRVIRVRKKDLLH